MQSELDTIAAIATPPGEGGVAIVRISGPEAGAVARAIFRSMKGESPPKLESHRIYHGRVHEPRTGVALDDVLLLYFAAGKSYTGDETVEISCHGGPLVARRILEASLAAGARPAVQGEFTRRAFLAGRIDLSQAEAVADIIAASSDRELINARRQLDGALSELVGAQAAVLNDALAEIESRIDFPDEEDIGALPVERLRDMLNGASAKLADLAETYREGRVLREGYRVAIVGRPNVGKSSLLNRLLGADRAIVTAEPGTTRDMIEERIVLRGVPFILADTAGLRNFNAPLDPKQQEDGHSCPSAASLDPKQQEDGHSCPSAAMPGRNARPPKMVNDRRPRGPEEIGIERTFAEVDARRTDPGGGLLLVLLDGSEPLQEDDFRVLESAREAPHIIALNKSDLKPALDSAQLPEPFCNEKHIPISALKGTGMPQLIEALVARRTSASGAPRSDSYLVTSARHKTAIDRSIEALKQSLDALETQPPEIVALEVRLAREALDEIAGVAMPDDILDIIFSRFCIGK